MKYFVLILICTAINSLDDTNEEYRKYYGLSFHKNCGNYIVTFKCLTACKSMGYQVFRLDYQCKCSCHELKTTTFLPAFVWRTNGTTRKVPVTVSPKLYDIVGTMSPSPGADTESTTIDTNSTDTANTNTGNTNTGNTNTGVTNTVGTGNTVDKSTGNTGSVAGGTPTGAPVTTPTTVRAEENA